MTTRWGILGTGRILAKLVGGFRLATGVELRAVASRDLDRARAAAKEFGIPVAHGSYEALLADPGIDVVFNALHNGLHCEWTVRALEAGKHVLCEKPLACNTGEVEQMFAAAHANNRLLMEGFMYRFHPQMTEAKRLVAAGAIGKITHVHSAYAGLGRERNNPRYRKDWGGGALTDLGCYCVNLSRLFCGEPTRVRAEATFDPETGIDLELGGTLEFAAGIDATFLCSFQSKEGAFAARIGGSEGTLDIPNPWLPPSPVGELTLTRNGKAESMRFAMPSVLTPFALEIEHLSACVRDGKSPEFPPGQDAERDSRANAHVLDALLASARRGSKLHLKVPP